MDPYYLPAGTISFEKVKIGPVLSILKVSATLRWNLIKGTMLHWNFDTRPKPQDTAIFLNLDRRAPLKINFLGQVKGSYG